MSKKQINVNFRVTSYEGDSEFNLPSSQAYAKIKQLAEEQNKWVYINNEIKNQELLTEEDLVKATSNNEEIVLMNALAGGNDVPKIVDINFKVNKKNKKAVVVELEETKHAKIFNVNVSSEQVSDVVRNRETILRVLTKKFEELADELFCSKAKEVDEKRQELKEEVESILEEYDDEMLELSREIGY